MSQPDRDKALLRHTPLDDDQFALMSEVETAAEHLGRVDGVVDAAPKTDKRWVAIGRTCLQIGMMCWRRAVGNPKKF